VVGQMLDRHALLLPDENGLVAVGGQGVPETAVLIVSQYVAQLLSRRRGDSPPDALSSRELEVLGLMAEGRSNTAIASRLVLTVGAVENTSPTSSRSCASRHRARITAESSPSSRTSATPRRAEGRCAATGACG
jgi:hypothetical protein